jgi:hypothetical protein
MLMSLLSSISIISAFKSGDSWFESIHWRHIQISAISSYNVREQLHHTVLNAIDQDRFIVGKNSTFANISRQLHLCEVLSL